jgi:Signal transduction histidine kinase regulating C4-dicarboxylate transport system
LVRIRAYHIFESQRFSPTADELVPDQTALQSTVSARVLFERRPFPAALVTAAAYFVGAQIAFLIGTLSDKIFAPFWPPNVVLFFALLLAPMNRWWLFFAVALPAHVAAELTVEMPMDQQLVAYATNCLVAGINALAVRKFVGSSNWFDSLRKASIYLLITGLLSPAFAALAGAFVQILGSGTIENYWRHWAGWYASNALGCIALGPVAMLWLGEVKSPRPFVLTWRHAEAVFVGVVLVLAFTIAFDVSSSIERGYLPALLYLPLPLILWSAVRFGVKGASGAVLVISLVLTWRALNGPNVFTTDNAESNVFALQFFLIGLSAPTLLLGAAIEETQRAERLTRESEERMAIAAASSSLCLWQYDLATGKFWTSEFCRTLFGLLPDVPITVELLLSRVHPSDFRLAHKAMKSTIEGKARLEIEFRIANGIEVYRWIAARAKPNLDEEGRATSITGTFVDISSRKAAEAEAATQRDEIAHLLRVSMLGELSGGLAHELTQPLTAILSNAQAGKMMLEKKSKDMVELSSIFDDIITEDGRAGEVIHRLRGLLKKGEVRHEAVDINALIESTLRLLHSELINRRVTIKYKAAPELAVARGDPVQLQQVLLNLFMNAMDAMDEIAPARRAINIVTAMTDDENIEVRITDCGIGLPSKNEQRVFQPFFTTKKRGLGLGLPICASIIQSHGGTLSLQNNVKEGATAVFKLQTEKVQDML